jgi:hypothetical protein
MEQILLRLYYSKRVNYCYILEQCAINFEIPLAPPLKKGESLFPLFAKEGLGEICPDVSGRILLN